MSELAEPFETLLGDELRQAAARQAESDLIDAVVDGFCDDDSGDDPAFALAGVGTPNAAQDLKEKTTVGLAPRRPRGG